MTPDRTRARETVLYWPALLVAGLDAVVFPIARFKDVLDAGFVHAATIGSVGMLALVFLWTLADSGVRRAVDAANKDLQGDRPFGLRLLPLFDPDWGLFGSRMGDGPLPAIRAVLFAEFLFALVTAGREPGPGQAALLLTMAGFGLAVLLTLVQLKRHYPESVGAG